MRNIQLTNNNLIIATAIIGVDTLWGGDVDDFSGTNRLIADSYFSDYELPPCFFDSVADRLRQNGGVLGSEVSNDEVLAFVEKFAIREAVNFLESGEYATTPEQKKYQNHMGRAVRVMLDLALAQRGLMEPIPYSVLVEAGTGFKPKLFDATAHRNAVINLLESINKGPSKFGGDALAAIAAWRQESQVDSAHMAKVNATLIPELEAKTIQNILPHLPAAFAKVPRSNVTFKPVAGANFSGSLNYLGKERNPDGSPQYEAIYEINADIEISASEFAFLVAHEVVPGHVMSTALTHYLCYSGAAGFGFENTIFPMCSPAATLSEGIANIAYLLANGWRSVEDIPSVDAQIAYHLEVLQDYGKANISYRLHEQKLAPEKICAVTRAECLLTEERAQKLTFGWAAHPLLGTMYMPAYAVGTDILTTALKKYGPEKLIPAVYGAHGPVDIYLTGFLP